MEFTPEQKENLVKAVKEYRKSEKNCDKAKGDLLEKLNKVKTCIGSNIGDADKVLAEAHQYLGQFYLEAQDQ